MDICPRCGGELEYDEVDIGVGTMRGNPGCPDCGWMPNTHDDLCECETCQHERAADAAKEMR